MNDGAVSARHADAVGHQLRGIETLQHVPLVFERNELLHGVPPSGHACIKANGPVRTMTKPGRLMTGPSQGSVDFDHLEVILGGAAVGTGPGVGHVLPARAGLDALLGQAQRLVLDEAADDTHPFA